MPEKLVGRGQHLGDLEFAGLGQPAMKNLQEQIAFQINKDRFCILIAALDATAAERLFGRADIDMTRQLAGCAESFDRDHQIARDTGEIAGPEFLNRDRPGAALRCAVLRPGDSPGPPAPTPDRVHVTGQAMRP